MMNVEIAWSDWGLGYSNETKKWNSGFRTEDESEIDLLIQVFESKIPGKKIIRIFL